MNRRRIPTFWLKLVLISLCISTLPVLLLGLLAYVKALSMVEEKVQIANIQLLQQVQMRLEQMLRTVDRQVFQLANSNPVMLAVRESLSYRDFQALRELQRDLKPPQTIDLPVHDVSLVSLSGRWLLNNAGFFPLDGDRLEQFRSYAGRPAWSYAERSAGNAGQGAQDAQAESGVPGSRSKLGDSIVYVYKIPDAYTEPEGLVVVEILAADFNKWMASRTGLGLGIGHTMVLDPQLRLLAHAEERRLGETLSGSADFERLRGEPGTEGMLESGRKAAEWMFFRKSEYNGWMYVSTVSRSRMAKDTAGIGWLAVYACLGVLLCTAVVSLLLARRVYRPVRRLYQTATDSGPRIPSERTVDEIEVISERFSRLRDQERKLTLRMESQARQLRDLFFLELLEGRLKERDIRESAAQFDLPGEGRGLCMIAADIDTLEGTRFGEQDTSLLLYAVGNMIQELAPPPHFVHTFTTGPTQVALFCDGPSAGDFLQTLFQLCKTVQNQAGQYLQLRISIGVSRLFHGLAHSPAAYRECLEALKYRIHFGESAILVIDELEPRQQLPPTRADGFKKELVQALKMADDVMAKAVFRLILEELSRRNASYKEYQLALLWLVLDIGQELLGSAEALMSFGTRGDKPLHERIAELKTVKETEAWFGQEVLLPLIREYEARLRSQYRTISAEMVRLIEAHFDTNITLEFCAGRLSYSPDYLKRVFRKETGMNFSDYVAQYRLRLAKQWLAGTDMSISEIADRLQYSNLQNFSRYFRKMEGVAPSEFRGTYRRPPGAFKDGTGLPKDG